VATLGSSEINILATGMLMVIVLLFFPLGIIGTLAQRRKLPRILNWD
jgi:branched-chain amino acid transport system permease protein